MVLRVNNSKGELVIDPYKNLERFKKNKHKKLAKFSEKNRVIVEQYIDDMERGRNVAGIKGPRGYTHLNTLLSRLTRIAELSKEKYNKTLIELNGDDAIDLFEDMRNGTIKKQNGKRYKSTQNYSKIFTAFWNWWVRINRRKGKNIDNIVVDLSSRPDHKPEFVYFNFGSLQIMLNEAKFDYKVLMILLFDSGIRAPTELMNIKRKDITIIPKSNIFQLQIRDEVSKTFGRKIKLMLSSDLVKQYLIKHKFKKNDFLFTTKPYHVNQYLKRLSQRVFGEDLRNLEENKSNKQLTMYDFRHSSCCYWLPRYKSESALKYRFGWKKSSMIYYYSEFLGMKDTIKQDDMLIDITKTEIEKELNEEKQKVALLEEQMGAMQKQINEELALVRKDIVVMFSKSQREQAEQLKEMFDLDTLKKALELH